MEMNKRSFLINDILQRNRKHRSKDINYIMK